jgi:hypothetical protein
MIITARFVLTSLSAVSFTHGEHGEGQVGERRLRRVTVSTAISNTDLNLAVLAVFFCAVGTARHDVKDAPDEFVRFP